MRDYDTILEKLLMAYSDTQKKAGSWQKEILLVLLEAVIGIYEDKRLEEIKKYS